MYLPIPDNINITRSQVLKFIKDVLAAKITALFTILCVFIAAKLTKLTISRLPESARVVIRFIVALVTAVVLASVAIVMVSRVRDELDKYIR